MEIVHMSCNPFVFFFPPITNYIVAKTNSLTIMIIIIGVLLMILKINSWQNMKMSFRFL